MRRGRRAALLAMVLALTLAPSTLAECFPGDLPVTADSMVAVGDAFLATVTDASDDVDSNPNGSHAYAWHVELAVDAIYRGQAPSTLSFNGFERDTSCSQFLGDGLKTGDVVIIAVGDLRPQYQPGEPFDGHVLIWRKTGTGWAFYEDALRYGADQDFYPAAARAATTMAAISRLISISDLPATSTLPEAVRSVGTSWSTVVVAALAFAVGLLISLRRFGQATSSRDMHRR